MTRQITRHLLPVTAAEIDRILRRAGCINEAGYLFTPDEDRPGVYLLNGPDGTAHAVTFLPEVADRYPETVRYLTYTDEEFEQPLATAPPMNEMPGVERIEYGNSIAYVSSVGEVGTMNALEKALERGDVIPAPVIARVRERLAGRERAEKLTIDGIDRRRGSARRAMAYDLLSAYLSLVAQDSQVPPGLSVDSRYLLSKGRSQDAAMLAKLFEVAGLPDTVEIDYDESKQISGAQMASALANQRQQAQRFLDTLVA